MDCTSCGRANRTGARFCGGCGAALSPRCPACGSECEAGARFCDACGGPLAAQAAAPAAEARKVVTIVFADLMGSTALHERVDPESARAFMERYYAAMRGAVEAERGQVTQLLGDGVKAVFGAPRVAEDDALRAVRAAVAMQRAFRALADAQRDAVGAVGLRVAVNTGEVVAQDEREIIGDPVNVAAHLQQQARDGDVLLGESTQRLVAQQVTLERVGTFSLKGRAEPVAAWRVTSLERPAGAPASAFVGREEEMRRILAVYEAAVSERHARLAVVLGSPGLGKSRLLAELARRLGDAATLLGARCDATGGATFEPLAEALRAHLCGDAEVDREGVRSAVEAALPADTGERARIAAGVAALLAGSPASPEETFFVVRRLLAVLAGARPVVLVIDDLHWAEPLLLDFVEHLVQWGGDVPLLVLAAARPELRDRRSSLAARGGLVADALTLAGLDAGAATRLAANAIGADELPAAIAGRVLAASEGNPLFVGELARMLVQDGALVREGDRWITRASLADLEMPPTIQALLAARIERLRPEERAVLERAAVVGRHFSRAAVAELLPPEMRRDLDVRLEALRRSELIESDTGWLLGEPVLRFHHVLIRDAAYRRLLKHTRAELHTRFADWLASRVGDAPEHDEMLGWHLEQAHALLCELGPLDARGHALGERAAGHLASAGRRALARDDLSLAAGLLGRALERLAADSPVRAELALDWCETLLAAGDVGPAERALEELGRLAGDSGRLRAWHVCFAAHLAALTDPQALGDTADAVAAAAQRLAAEGDAAGEAKAHSVHALVLSRLGRIGASEGALDLALAAARRGRDRRRSNAVLAGAPLAALWGPSPVTRASGRCLDVVRVLRITQGAPAVEAVALRCQGVLEALRGRADAARRMVASSRRLVEELGITQRLLEAELFAGRIELLEGDFAAAERCLRTAYDGLRAQGLDIDAAQAAALLGRALLAQGRGDEALELSRESEQLAGDDRIAGIAWRCVRAEALARRGEHASAVEIASRAVELGAATDALLDHADARMALATALRAAGRAGEAGAEEARAISLWEAKGATLLVERALRPAQGPAPIARAADVAEGNAGPRRIALGDALALIRSPEEITLLEIDAAGQERTLEIFPVDRLGDAIARLYERYAELQPEGPSRESALAAARSVALMIGAPGGFDAERAAGCFADDFESMDHRRAGFGSSRGVRPFLRALESAFEVADDVTESCDDVLALQPDALLVRRTLRGHSRASGGAFESPTWNLVRLNPAGRFIRAETFGPEQGGEALARFEALTAKRPASPRRVRANAATRLVVRLDAAIAAKDAGALRDLFAEDMQVVHHPTGTQYGREGTVIRSDALLRAQEPHFVHEPVATLGDSLVLCRVGTSVQALADDDVAPVGAVEREARAVIEVDAQGRECRVEIFAEDRLADALACQYARYAEQLPAGPERERAAATARTVAILMAPLDVERYAAALAPDVEYVDRRRMGIGAVRGADVFLRGARTLVETASDFGTRVDDVLALLPDAFLVRSTTYGVDRASGGAYERPLLVLGAFGPDGRASRIEWFDPEADAEAFARFDALADAPAEERFANAAARTREIFERRWRERDWEGVDACFAPGFRMEDRRALVGLSLSGPEFVANLRLLAETSSSTFETELIATRGERLALSRARFSGEVAGGAFENWQLSLLEVDEQGRRIAVTLFDVGDLDAAYAELDRRFVAGEGAPHAELLANLSALRRRYGPTSDLDALARVLADDFRFLSHRHLFYTRTPSTRDEHLADFRDLFHMGADTSMRDDHVRVSARAAIADSIWSGRRDDGDFEIALVRVYAHDGHLFHSLDLYDADQLDAALTRYAELSAPASPRRIGNLATRTEERACEAFAARDWDGFAALFAPHFRSSDRRQLMGGLELDRQQLLEPLRPIFELAPRRTHRVLATRGDHLALVSVRLEAGNAANDRSEVEFIQVIEVDDRGVRIAAVGFDPDDVEAAYAELDLRFAAQQEGGFAAQAEGGRRASLTRAFTEAFAARDWDALAALLAPDLAVNDHRRLGWETLRGPDAYVQALRSLVELAPDVSLRVDHAEMRDPGYLYFTSWQGTREGGAFEEPSWIVCELDEEGRIRRFDQYALEQRAEAEARLAAIGGASGARDLLRIPPNAATRAIDGHQRALETQDWDSLAAGLVPDMRFDDRRRGVLVSGNRDQFVAGCRLIGAAQGRLSRTLLATAGERLALEHARWAGGSADVGAYEAENLSLVEVDTEGRIVAIVSFDPDDRRGASREMFERYAEGEGGRTLPRAALDAFRAMNARDLDALRGLLPAEFDFHDHRRTGLGRLRVDEYLASLSQLLEQAPDLTVETLHTIEIEKYGELAISRMSGTQVDGGGEFESISVRLSHFEADRLVGVEAFELEDLEAARARFEALRPDPLRIPPNAATRAIDVHQLAFAAGDWDALADDIAPGMVFDDRRRGVLVSGDRDQFIRGCRMIGSTQARLSTTLLATAGDRLALEHERWSGSADGGGAYEAENLSVVEVDADGHIAAIVAFDPDDHRAAAAEMRERFFRGEAAPFMPRSAMELLRAWDDHDLARVRAAIPDDFYLHDHRRTGVGRVDGADAYVESVSALFEHAPDLAADTLYQLALEEHGSLSVGRTHGRLAEGGAVESVFLRLNEYTGGRVVGMELFELESLDAARARFEALRPDPLRIPPNAASRASDRWHACVEAGDWDGLRNVFSPALVWEDRRQFSRTTGDREALLASVQLVHGARARVQRTRLSTCGDRLMLELTCFTRADSGTFEVELQLVECDADGRIVTAITLDPDDRRMAALEMFERYACGEGARKLPRARIEAFRAQNAHDLTALRTLLPPEFVFCDHRRTGLGRIGLDDWLASMAHLFAQAPDLCFETLYIVASEAHGELTVGRMFGTQITGGAFEGIHVRLSQFEGDRLASTEVFEPEQLDVARARFEALRPAAAPKAGPSAPARFETNNATRAMRRFQACVEARDWHALTDLHAPEFVYDDRRPLLRDTGSREKFVASVRLSTGAGARESHTVVATAGKSLALIHQRFVVVRGDVGISELEMLLLVEIGADGRFVSFATFDVGDRAAAEAELRARHEAQRAR
ncbi:MAG TPA: nuclear transport factor 2 family protein, partial [Myxococcota bacterium]|nr:nuclear transport factor 2 family protein [Myxococcota bacterium]